MSWPKQFSRKVQFVCVVSMSPARGLDLLPPPPDLTDLPLPIFWMEFIIRFFSFTTGSPTKKIKPIDRCESWVGILQSLASSMSPARMSVKLSPDARGLIQTCKNNGRAGVPGLLAKIVYRKLYTCVDLCQETARSWSSLRKIKQSTLPLQGRKPACPNSTTHGW